MPISVVCLSCGKGLRVPDNAVGRTVKCPNCGATLLVQNFPQQASGPAGVEPSQRVRPGESPTPRPAAEPAAPLDDDPNYDSGQPAIGSGFARASGVRKVARETDSYGIASLAIGALSLLVCSSQGALAFVQAPLHARVMPRSHLVMIFVFILLQILVSALGLVLGLSGIRRGGSTGGYSIGGAALCAVSLLCWLLQIILYLIHWTKPIRPGIL